MSIIARQTMLKNIEQSLEKRYTNPEVQNIMALFSDELNNYSVEEVGNPATGGSFVDYLNAFLEAKAIEGRSDKTIAHYRYIITTMMNDLNLPLNKITVFHLRNYLMKRKQKGISDVTLEGERSVFSSFFGWLQREGLLQINPCGNIGAIKCVKEIKLPFSNIDIEKLKEACTCPRDSAIVYFLLATGCRVSEVCGVNKSDINLINRECHVLGKGKKERIVYLNEVSAMHIQRYLNSRTDNYESLFIGKGSTRLKPGGMRKILHGLEKKAQITNVHPHRFRRTLATNLINRGMTIQEVAKILGHDKLDTTMKYVCLSQNDIKNNYRKFL